MTEADKKAKPARDATENPELVVADQSANNQKPAASKGQALDKKDTVGAGNPSYSNPGGGIVQRRSRWYSSLAALRYVNSLSKDDDVRVRDSDRATSISLLIGAIFTVISLIVPQLAPHRVPLVLACDALVGVMLLFYVANRFGILNTLSPRQALLTWQLLMGATFLGIFMTINFALIIALEVSRTAIQSPLMAPQPAPLQAPQQPAVQPAPANASP
ncbi:MAG TPA: hypothetical protein V6C89_07260 [Drouetiella sp.]|jgi:hypothetical protein